MVQDLVANDLHHLEALGRGDRVHEHVAMNADKVLRVQDAVLILHSTSLAIIQSKSISHQEGVATRRENM